MESPQTSKSEKTKTSKPAADARQTSVPGTDSATQVAAESAKPLPTAEDKKRLGDAFLAADKGCADAEKALDAARAKKSETVAAIIEAFGHKGPYRIGGRQFTASARKGESGGFTMREVSEVKDDLG